jgi:hypothetical protein
MDSRFDTKTVISIVTGTILLIITNAMVWNIPLLGDEWAIRICAVILVIVASVSGTITGILVPLVSCLLTGVVFGRPDAFIQMGILLVTGAVTGHYAEKTGVKYGRFSGIAILDYVVIETGAAVIAWLCIQPLLNLYAYKRDLRVTIPGGLYECLISVGGKLFICLPVLLILNHFFRKRQMVEDAKREYLYHAGK